MYVLDILHAYVFYLVLGLCTHFYSNVLIHQNQKVLFVYLIWIAQLSNDHIHHLNIAKLLYLVLQGKFACFFKTPPI